MKIELNGMLINIPTDQPDRNGRLYSKEVMEKAFNDYLYKIKIESRLKKIKKLKNGRVGKM